MVVENRRSAGMSKDISITPQNLVCGKGRIVLRRGGIMVIDERHGLGRHHADDARSLSAVRQRRQIIVIDRILQGKLQGEIEGSALVAGGVDPIHNVVGVSVPVLADGKSRARAGDVNVAQNAPGVTLHEIETPALESDVGFEPIHPVGELLLDGCVGVIDVRRGGVVLARVGVAGTASVGLIVDGDGRFAPVELCAVGASLEETVTPLGVLAGARAMVDDNVGNRAEADGTEGADGGL
eukprot:TRINITY_DN7318_c0_g1_i1.p2 TRINITY_DN7318_c0_g1~~TRINITY_DN7318_c0_g1_i1.p2  ORF type:complete len:239 (+),score=-9.68 TRINITY_DN7318_c0_g1_i1:398-1114(+)